MSIFVKYEFEMTTVVSEHDLKRQHAGNLLKSDGTCSVWVLKH